MTFKVYFSEPFKKQLAKIKDRQEQEKVLKRVKNLREDAKRHPHLHYHLSEYRKLRIGGYRVLYRVIDDIVSVEALILKHKYPKK